MATSCSCTNPAFPNLGRPNCVIRKKKVSFVGLMPRYNALGVRNSIDASSATLGATITALVSATTAPLSRLYLFPKMEEVKFERSATAYKTAASGTKFKLDGEGGIRTFSGMLMGDAGVEPIARQLQTLGCSEFDIYEFTVDGNIWGVLDNPSATALRGYAVEKETFDAFIVRAVDGDINNISVSWDLEDDNDTVNSYAITAEELGYKSTSLRPNIAGTCIAIEGSSTTIVATVTTDFGTAGVHSPIVGLLTANFVVKVGAVVVVASAVETVDGVYTLTFTDLDIDPTNVVDVNVVGVSGYAISSGQFTALL